MATKKKATPAEYDRWDSPRANVMPTNKPTAAQKKLAQEINAQRAAAKKKKK